MTPEFIEGSDDRRVELTSERWEHIVGTHGELADHREDVYVPCGSQSFGSRAASLTRNGS